MASLPDVEGTAPFRSVRRPRQRGLLVASLNRHLSALKAQRASLRFCPGSFYTVNKKCLPNKNNICQTKQVFAKQSEYLPNYLRFPKEFVK